VPGLLHATRKRGHGPRRCGRRPPRTYRWHDHCHAAGRFGRSLVCAAGWPARSASLPVMRCGSMASSSQPGGAEQPVLVPLLRWSSPAQVALPAVLRPARRFVPSA